MLDKKFKNNTINKSELIELLNYTKKSKNIKIDYKSFFKVNMCKSKPENITDSEYGKFFRMLNYISYKNKLEHSNGKAIKMELIAEHLGYSTIKSFKRFINKLSKYRMLGEMTLGGIRFIVINPAYAQRKMTLNNTVYSLFKEDLDEFLNEYQKRLLTLEEDDIEISTVIHMQ